MWPGHFRTRDLLLLLVRSLLGLALVGCATPSYSFVPDEEKLCSASMSESGRTSPFQYKAGPCRGDKHRGECALAGLPSAWGVEVGCETPLRQTDEDSCIGRARRLEGCETLEGRIVCCPEE